MSPDDPESDARRKRKLWMLLALLVVFLCTIGIQVARFTGDAGAGEVLETPVTTVAEPNQGGSPAQGGAPPKNQDDPNSSGRASSNGGTGSDVSGSSGSAGSSSGAGPVTLVPATPGYPISGSVPRPLRPGAPAQVIPIVFNSPNQGAGGSGLDGTRVTSLTITISTVTGSGGGPNPCTAADFQITQVDPLAYPFYVPFGTRTLASLIAGAYLPTMRMVNRTDSVPGDDSGNQDACKSATVNLSFVAAP